jgi:CDP-diacylglycerol--glycerol-3-phosphate 3-phosphatidyltransferase
MTLADQLTVTRILAVPFVVVLYALDFHGDAYWATSIFVAAMWTDWFDGRVARWSGKTTALGSLLDPVADKVLVMATLVMLVSRGVFPGWMVAAIIVREFVISGLRLAAIERGIVVHARDLAKLKTWAQAIACGFGGYAAAGAWRDDLAWWSLLVAVVLTWASAADYVRVAPALLRGTASPAAPPAPARAPAAP